MVGICTALHLQQRGFDVVLVDRRAPGQETSMGNAGLIQREAVEPYPFPREPSFLLDVALGRGAKVHWHAQGLWQMGKELLGYLHHSHPLRHAVANTEDVGDRFTHEVRRMHYGDAESRSIRGKASLKETVELLEEGIDIMPLPPSIKETLQ